ncbi:MAG: hypothetical protein JWO80_3322 [Bryobacterales bacterium]|nr:hypothetical protein [Bryobacterales bacterium]
MAFVFLFVSLALAATGCTSLTKGGDVGTFKIGDRAQVGWLIYNVIDTQWDVKLGLGPAPRIPKSRFFIVNMTVVNSGPTDQTIPTFNLVDDQGESHPELDNGENVPDWMGVVRKVRPAESFQGNIVFDVPPKHYRLKLTEESEQKYAWIEIPLDFGVPPPTADQPSDAIPAGPASKR